jgi:hypothetical protein
MKGQVANTAEMLASRLPHDEDIAIKVFYFVLHDTVGWKYVGSAYGTASHRRVYEKAGALADEAMRYGQWITYKSVSAFVVCVKEEWGDRPLCEVVNGPASLLSMI